MPLIVISGLPSSGKSNRTNELKVYFESKGKKVNVVSENVSVPKAGFKKNEFYNDSQKEKMVRSDLKSDTVRLLNKDDVTILDAGNYIKGYRYELFCATKAARSTQCTLFCAIQNDKAWNLNCQRTQNEENASSEHNILNNSDIPYTREIFDALCMRYEEPHGNCRWDSPLFVVFPEDKLNFDEIFDAIYSSKPLPPNQSTQNAPLSGTNYLFELDKLTQHIVNDITSARKIGILGPVPVKGTTIKVAVPNTMNAAQLNRLRRQFLNYSKMHTTASSLDKVPQLFVQFLNSSFNK